MTTIVRPLSSLQLALALGLEPRRRVPQALAPHGAARADRSDSGDGFEAIGRAIGRDYARHGLMPSPDHLHPGHPVRQGWEAARARLMRGGAAALPATRHVRRWLALRLAAWMRGHTFDTLQVTPTLLMRIDAEVCPVTRESLAAEGSTPAVAGGLDEGVVVALREEAGFVAGNLAVVSARAARALAGEEGEAQLDAHAARRAADLRALVTPVPHAQTLARPLSVLPPPRVRVLNAAHELQVLLTTLFSGGAYARRMSALGTLMPDAASRRAYATLMSTLLARRLESEWAAGREQVHQALEDAWLHPTVQRRWAELMGHLTGAQCARIVRRALERGLAAGRARWLEPERAVEGWGMGSETAYTTQS